MRTPTEEDWRRWREIRERNDVAERLAGTDCYASDDLVRPPYDDIAIHQHEKDQFERATVVLVEDNRMALLERPDGDSSARGSASREPDVGARGERQMEWTIPGAIIDEALSPWDEFALIDLRTGKVVIRITDAEMEARCPECGLDHDDEVE